MAPPADPRIRMACLALLRVGFGCQTMTVTNPCQSMIFWLLRVAGNTRGIFMAHAAALRIRAIGHAMFLLIIHGVIGRARGWAVAHRAIRGSILAIMANKTVFHLRIYNMTIEGFPFGDTRMAATAFIFIMLLMGKNEKLVEPFPCSCCFAGFFKMAKTAIALFTGFKVTFKATFFTGAAKSIINDRLLRKNPPDI